MARMLKVLALTAVLACAKVLGAPAADRVTSIPGYPTITSPMYAGYLQATSGRKAFYTFVESTGNPTTDPLVLWLNGGPGCSSLLGFFEENGPVTMRHKGAFEPNAYAWNQMANMLFIESPGGVGFSTDTNPPTVWDDDLAAAFNLAALTNFFTLFPEFGSHKMFLTGESYAGFYVPELAYEIYKSNDTAMKSRMNGFMVGNPCTGQYGCANPDPFLNPFLQYNGFSALTSGLPTDQVAQNNYDPYDLLVPNCDTASTLNQARFSTHPVVKSAKKRLAKHYEKIGGSQYAKDTLGSSGEPYPYGPCADSYVTAWLNRADVQAALHVTPGINWQSCNSSISFQYNINLNGVVPLYREMFDNTEWSIQVYSGLDDSIVNQAQTQTIVNNFGRPLAGTKQFQAWYRPDVYNASETQLGGFFVQYDRVTWAGVRNAGHMVPQFNPPAALELFRSYLAIGRAGRLTD